MSRSLSSRLRGPLLGAAVAALVLTTTTALAGSGVGGVFNLGQVNTVDAPTSLSGNPGGSPELKVVSSGTGAAVRGEASIGIGINGISDSGTGEQGVSQSGIGLLGIHSSTSGINAGVEGRTNSNDPGGAGVLGRNTAGGPGLRAIVSAGTPPLAVNSSAKVASLNSDLLDGLDSTGFWKLGGNADSSPGRDFVGTTDDRALVFKVNGQRAFRLEPAATDSPVGGGANVIGGQFNEVEAGADSATIAGGGVSTNPNRVTDFCGTVGGGVDNRAGNGDHNPFNANCATVAGGGGNTAAGGGSTISGGSHNTTSGTSSTIGGGEENETRGYGSVVNGGLRNVAQNRSTIGGGSLNSASGEYSTIAGGYTNYATGLRSSVGGGQGNKASGANSTVAGGEGNQAAGNFSFAAGRQAKATEAGSFVWGDNRGGGASDDVTSPAANTFTVRASGGIWLGTTSSPAMTAGHFIDTSTGAYLSSAGAWTNSSDRALKHDFHPLDKGSVLEQVARMPITSWSYKAEKPPIRHIGPMAQDFYKAFGLGLDNKHITTIDEGGVALAAIQGLYRQNKTLQRENQKMQRENRSLRAQLDAQNTRLTKLEQAFSKPSR
jgi:Chaperone of endosialidase